MDHESLMKALKKFGYIQSESVKKAFENVDRKKFVLPDYKTQAYADTPLPIKGGQTISAPSMVAIMLEASNLKKGLDVLEIGCGSGYNVALIAEIVGEQNVVTIERIPELAEWGEKNLESAGYTIKVITGDGTLGYPERAPYDRIISTAAAPKIPQPWKEQVKVGGLIVSPVGSKHWYQELEVAEKKEDGTLDIAHQGGCAFVPLIGEEGFNR